MTERENEGQLSAADVIIRQLSALGIDYFFANGGTDFPPIVEAYSRAATEGATVPKPLIVTHENAAVAMAHGVYLATGRPQAVMVHVNVGTANTVNALLDAARDNVPVLLLAGRSPYSETGRLGTRSQHIHWAQEMFDQAGLVREATKWEYELHIPEQAADVVTRALEVATASPAGPVYLTLPRDILALPAADALDTPRRARAASPSPDLASLEGLAELIAAADHPLIVTANAGRTREGFDALSRFAERFSVPVVSFHPRYACLSTDHPMHLGFLSGPQVAKADLIIVLECDVPWIPSLDTLRPDAKVVHIGEDPSFVRYPMRSFPMDMAIRATPAAALDALAVLLDRRPDIASAAMQRRERLAEPWAALRRNWAAMARIEDETMTADHVSRVLGELLPPEAVVVNEYTLRPPQLPRSLPGTFFGLSPSGGLGWGLGAALGIKLAQPEKLVVATLGDGAYMFANPTACHWTAQMYDLPVLSIIFNNQLYGAVRNSTMAMYKDGAAASIGGTMLADLSPAPDFEKLVEASGGHGQRVERASELRAALEKAIEVVTVERRQALVNVLIA
ncbi:thiamine pyrophosphate-requiring protein [Pelagibacterium lacus]|uniref:Thiamine pyrophosphate-requiring protein n=1 Tax=Pelagibacterium lacus TaxID=2282655 RepID=A0A369VZM4_9HYPH|nr:thiamine pyrophosphate-requiring protein [Pelagibacterium lacus]RDE07864.1 thiamine pyrophosphate-requiring protein [Pelagibacterium lacus]